MLSGSRFKISLALRASLCEFPFLSSFAFLWFVYYNDEHLDMKCIVKALPMLSCSIMLSRRVRYIILCCKFVVDDKNNNN